MSSSEVPYTRQEIKEAQDRTTARKQKEAMQGLLAHPGWRMLTERMQAQVAARTEQVVFTPLSKAEWGLEAQEYMKGEIGALRLVLAWPDQVIEAATALLEAMPEPEDGPDGGSDSGDTDDTYSSNYADD